MKQIIVRQFQHENWAHIFLYATVLATKKSLDSNGIILPLEVYIDGYVLGKIIEVSIESDKKELVNTTVELLKNYKISEDDFKKAAEQVAIKNGWQLHLSEDELGSVINNINTAKPWVNESQLKLLHEDDNNKDLIAPGVRYEVNRTDTPVMGSRIFINNCPSELRALAVLIIDMLVSSAINQMTLQNLPVVLVDSQWAEGLPVVGMAATITGSKNALEKITNIKPFFDNVYGELAKKQFENKAATIITAMANDISELFPADELAWYSGVVMGVLGWQEVATETNIKAILNKLQIENIQDS